MSKRIAALLLPLAAIAAFFTLGIVGQTAAQTPGKTAVRQHEQTPRTGYAPVNGLRMYFEVHSNANPARPPLVLLHGGGDTIKTSFGRILPELARDRQVIAFEQQGYGHTADVADRPFRFEQSADDTAALLDYLHFEKADLFGFSNGGTIALQVAIRHPKVVRASSSWRRPSGSAMAPIHGSGRRWPTPG